MSRVLVVDDEPHVRDLASRALDQVGLECDTAGDGQEAIERFDAAQHQAVITDLRMPHRNGHSLASDLLSQPKPPSVVVMTALSDQRLIRELLRCGVDDIYMKPFDYRTLALRLLALTEKKRRPRPAPRRQPAKPVSSELMKIEKSLMEITAIFAERLEGIFQSDAEISEPPLAVTEFISRYAKLDQTAADRFAVAHHNQREHKRVACPQPVVVVPVDRMFVPEGEPFMAAIQDVSEQGIRLLHTRSLTAQYAALRWKATTLPYAEIRVVVNVERCQPRGLYYDIAGQFVLAD